MSFEGPDFNGSALEVADEAGVVIANQENAKKEKPENKESGKEEAPKQEQNEEEEKIYSVEELEKMNYYERLNVPYNASAELITKKYRKLSKKYHPDVTQGDRLPFQYINEAHETLKDPLKRKYYDIKLKQKHEEKERREKEAEAEANKNKAKSKADQNQKQNPNKKPKNKKSPGYSDSSSSSSGSGTTPKPEEPKKGKGDKNNPGFFNWFFVGFWKSFSSLWRSGSDH
jgi:curved DNA-binding protein CbpA